MGGASLSAITTSRWESASHCSVVNTTTSGTREVSQRPPRGDRTPTANFCAVQFLHPHPHR
jgi:hypothetical protein